MLVYYLVFELKFSRCCEQKCTSHCTCQAKCNAGKNRSLCSSINIFPAVNLRVLGSTGYLLVERMEDTRIAYNVSVAKHEVWNPLKGSRRRSENNITIDLKIKM